MHWMYKEKTLGVAGLHGTHGASPWAHLPARTSHKEAGMLSLRGSLSTSVAHTNAHGHMDATPCCNTDPTHHGSGPWAHGTAVASRRAPTNACVRKMMLQTWLACCSTG